MKTDSINLLIKVLSEIRELKISLKFSVAITFLDRLTTYGLGRFLTVSVCKAVESERTGLEKTRPFGSNRNRQKQSVP